MDRLPRITLADIIDRFVDWITMTFGGFFDGIA
ncbi:glycine/betaine ABC transporter, partial [Bacillus velezensis]